MNIVGDILLKNILPKDKKTTAHKIFAVEKHILVSPMKNLLQPK